MSALNFVLVFILCLIVTYILAALGPIGYFIGIAIFFTLLINVVVLLRNIYKNMQAEYEKFPQATRVNEE
ncbi:hypothetical protein BCM02_10586 [Paenibacillus methanolicus]|uniref:Uncharacterized protein n=1 Tax=Paenibacillus methanolicus TaxID=582686 RepID=A0A5S5C7T2_9BACL|nr:hypothetical protein BCM02_10586 [Paenibacillus methanolicus]